MLSSPLRTAICTGLAAFWAGVSLSGNLVAAPAKFQVAALEMPLALQVGRAQFTWIGYIEWALLGLLLANLLPLRTRPPLLLLLPVTLFLTQQLWLQPLLEARSDLIIAGQTPPASNAHLLFAGLEAVKCACLTLFSALSLIQITRRAQAT